MFRHLIPQFTIIHGTFFVEAVVRKDKTLGRRMFIIPMDLGKKCTVTQHPKGGQTKNYETRSNQRSIKYVWPIHIYVD